MTHAIVARLKKIPEMVFDPDDKGLSKAQLEEVSKFFDSQVLLTFFDSQVLRTCAA